MSDKPILFSAPMVRALLAGRKTQTRRVIKWLDGNLKPKPKFAAGDRLWVREMFSGPHEWTGIPPSGWGWDTPGIHPEIWRWADGNPEYGDWTRPKPGIHMPRWASRITLTATDVRVQRLQEVSETDAIAEGIEYRDCWGTWRPDGSMQCGGSPDPREAFRCLWININGNGSWEANPLVAAYTFTVEQKNIDA